MTGPTSPLADQLRGLAQGLGGLLGEVGRDAGGDHSAECRTCPLCTALAVLRGQRPDVSEALADLLTTAATALRGLSQDAAADPGVPDPGPDPRPASPPAPVQRIEVA